MPANDKQVGGEHYGLSDFQHWDMVKLFNLDYFQGQITKYVMRHNKKNGKQDLEKAMHFLQKYIELEYPDQPECDCGSAENPTRTIHLPDCALLLWRKLEDERERATTNNRTD